MSVIRVVSQGGSTPISGAVVVVNVIGGWFNIGGYYAQGTTNSAGEYDPPDYGIFPPPAGTTADVYVNYTDGANQKWYALGTLTLGFFGNWMPDPLILQLTPGSVKTPGPGDAFNINLPWWFLPAVGLGVLGVAGYVVYTNPPARYVATRAARGVSAGLRRVTALRRAR